MKFPVIEEHIAPNKKQTIIKTKQNAGIQKDIIKKTKPKHEEKKNVGKFRQKKIYDKRGETSKKK